MKNRKIIVGDEIEVNTPIGSRIFKVVRISPCGKWAITSGYDYFRITVDDKGCTTKKGHKGSKWYVYWQVLRFKDSPIATTD